MARDTRCLSNLFPRMLPEMASFCSAKPSQLTTSSRPPIPNSIAPVPTFDVIRLSPKAILTTSNFRLMNSRSLHPRRRTVSTSASHSSNGNPIKGGNDETTPPESAQGPPFLTILAGLVVFFLICWGFSSVVMWLIGFVAKLISSN